MVSRTVEWIARHERATVSIGLVGAIFLAWAFLLGGAGTDMSDMSDGHSGAENWSGRSVAIFTMWVAMMVAMMLPSAAPAILLFAALMRARSTSTIPSTGVFAAGYALVWTGFSLVATIAHWTLQQSALISPAIRSTSGVLAGVLLVSAGVYQMTPLKSACLHHCRSPIQFFTQYWRPGAAGAFRLGLLHGAYCVGCCWALMGLLFVGGAANLWWVGAMAAFILLEKIAFLGTRVGRTMSGVGMALAGAVTLAVA